jgi:hypothetical protein
LKSLSKNSLFLLLACLHYFSASSQEDKRLLSVGYDFLSVPFYRNFTLNSEYKFSENYSFKVDFGRGFETSAVSAAIRNERSLAYRGNFIRPGFRWYHYFSKENYPPFSAVYFELNYIYSRFLFSHSVEISDFYDLHRFDRDYKLNIHGASFGMGFQRALGKKILIDLGFNVSGFRIPEEPYIKHVKIIPGFGNKSNEGASLYHYFILSVRYNLYSRSLS